MRFLALTLMFTSCIHAAEYKLPWLKSMGTVAQIEAVTSVEAKADVTVSDGLTFSVSTSWQDSHRSIFHAEYPDRKTTMGRSGEYYWAYDGTKQIDMDKGIKGFVLGHQYHALLIHFEQFEMQGEPNIGQSNLCECMVFMQQDADKNTQAIHYTKDSMLPQFIETTIEEFGVITTKLSNWQKVDELQLPMALEIDDGQRIFNYVYKEVSLNSNAIHQARKPSYETLNDEQQLIRLHRDMMDAHIHSDASLMEHIWAEEVMIVNRGEISISSGKDAADFMKASLSARRHSEYIDLAKPVVTISPDGQLGHIAVRVNAKGYGIDESGTKGGEFEFTSAWIATFEKFDGQWKMTANASNFM